MILQKEGLGSSQDVMAFIGSALDYRDFFVPNLPLWADIWLGNVPNMSLVVCSARDESGKLIACDVRVVFDVDLAEATKIKGDFSRCYRLGYFGAESEELKAMAETLVSG